MKIALAQIKMAETGLTKFVEQNIPIGLAFKMGKLVSALNSELQEIEKIRIKLITKYGTEDPETKNIAVSTDNMEPFIKEWTDFLVTEVDIDFEPMDESLLFSSELEDVKMTTAEIMSLQPFFTKTE